MFKKTTALYAVVISSIVIGSVFAIGFVQQAALAQANQTNSSSANQTNSTGGNQTSSNSTSGGSGAVSPISKGTTGSNGY